VWDGCVHQTSAGGHRLTAPSFRRSAFAKFLIRGSWQLDVFRLRLLEDRDVRIAVLPKGEEILVGNA